jgi:hypothetical protein
LSPNPSFQDILSPVLSILALCVSLASLSYTVRQIQLVHRQIHQDINFRIIGINRELLGLAFHDPELFLLFEDLPMSNPRKQKHYIQMWLNHAELMWGAAQRNLIEHSMWYSMQKEFRDFFSLSQVQRHWDTVKEFYSPGFVQFVAEFYTSKKL